MDLLSFQLFSDVASVRIFISWSTLISCAFNGVMWFLGFSNLLEAIQIFVWRAVFTILMKVLKIVIKELIFLFKLLVFLQYCCHISHVFFSLPIGWIVFLLVFILSKPLNLMRTLSLTFGPTFRSTSACFLLESWAPIWLS